VPVAATVLCLPPQRGAFFLTDLSLYYARLSNMPAAVF